MGTRLIQPVTLGQVELRRRPVLYSAQAYAWVRSRDFEKLVEIRGSSLDFENNNSFDAAQCWFQGDLAF